MLFSSEVCIIVTSHFDTVPERDGWTDNLIVASRPIALYSLCIAGCAEPDRRAVKKECRILYGRDGMIFRTSFYGTVLKTRWTNLE